MELASLPFLAFVLIAVALFHAAPTAAGKKSVLTLLNLVFLSTFAKDLQQLIPLVAFLVIAWLSAHLVNRCKATWAFIAVLALLIGLFVYLKRYAFVQFLPGLNAPYVTVGLSYMFFRALHVVIDTYQADEKRTDLHAWTGLNYLTSFLSLTAGPIQRYEEYLKQEADLQDASPLRWDSIRVGLARAGNGYIKIAIVGHLLKHGHQLFFDAIPHNYLALTGAAVCHLLYVYVNFSGYMDIVVGLGRLFGLTLPENFAYPFLARNFLDLWNRWHITLSNWFKTYVFNPLIRCGSTTFTRPSLRPYIGVLAYFVVFFLLGLWHGTGLRYIVLGVLLGLGVATNKLWEVQVRRLLGTQRHQALNSRRWYQSLAGALALTYFIMSAIASWELPQAASLPAFLRSIGLPLLIVNFSFCAALLFALSFVARVVGDYGIRYWEYVETRFQHASWSLAGLTARLVLVLSFLLPMPERRDQPAREPIKSTAVFYAAF
jgi:alginate O-acetyltransferase complex protein AlgI